MDCAMNCDDRSPLSKRGHARALRKILLSGFTSHISGLRSPLFDQLFSKVCFQKGTGARIVPIRSPSPDKLRSKFHKARSRCQRGRCELGQLASRPFHQPSTQTSQLTPSTLPVLSGGVSVFRVVRGRISEIYLRLTAKDAKHANRKI
jgi:hypothetical protein